ncbi:LysR family transcriptional regulator [Paludicola sp. MB14-C6]|uniref:LysR family transcriptional regulator n=1 Tax=Paludihabitans sp. MB14-C6 TaxID=3070656 RepID=UPI0027DAC101|nr:LysR family transcriptional regulator [Paludicola sp. MB14-C6]WMJ21855.1 LysR family transcriptional regulator [Paludicola sp. MB14-C6]
MAVKLELYRVFKTVCEMGSISDAAKELFISQSAVSQSIKQLEESLSMNLFHRTPTGVVLTAEGQTLYEYASSAMDLLTAGEKKLEAMKNLLDGDLKVAASDTISQYLLLNKLETFHNAYPKIKLQIFNRTTLESVALLKSGKVDLAFVNLPLEDDELIVEPILTVHDIFVGNPLTENYVTKIFSLQEAAELPLILLENKANSRRYIQNFFQSHGIQLQPEIELGSHELLLEFAKINLGVSCVMKEFSKHYLKTGELVELRIAPPIPERQIGVVRLKGLSITNSVNAFLKICQENENPQK